MGKLGIIFFVISGLFIQNIGFAKKSELGELPRKNYYGPHLPLFRMDQTTKDLITDDDYFEKWYFQSKMQTEFFILDEYLKGDFLSAHYCPESFLTKYEEYYRYLIRLLTISYIYEANKDYVFTAKQMGYEGTCQMKWEQVFNSCRPKTKEMKNFIGNVKHFFPHIKDILVPFELAKQNRRKDWFDTYNKGQYENLTQARLAAWGVLHQKESKINERLLRDRLHSVCEEDQKELIMICSEADSLYGLSNYLEVYSLLARSDAMSWMVPSEYQLGCLRQYIKENRSKEVRSSALSAIFPYIYSKKLTDNVAFEQGDLFIYGAFKQFTDKGLKEVFADKKVIPSVEKEAKIVKVDKPEFEKIILPTPVKVNRKLPIKKSVPKKEVVLKQSSFKISADLREMQDLDEVPVDMEKFHFDYIFTREQEKQFDSFVVKFSSQKALQDMKKGDGLGQKKAPIPLKFLKYLMDKEMHKGLFNIVYVLGEKFYVINDIDSGNEICFVNMSNAKETGFKWQLKLIRP